MPAVNEKEQPLKRAITGVHSNEDLMCKNRGIYGFLGSSWVLNTIPRRHT